MHWLEVEHAIRPELWPLLDDPETSGPGPGRPPLTTITSKVLMRRKRL